MMQTVYHFRSCLMNLQIVKLKNNMGMFDTGHQGLIKLFLLMLVRYLLDIAMQMT